MGKARPPGGCCHPQGCRNGRYHRLFERTLLERSGLADSKILDDSRAPAGSSNFFFLFLSAEPRSVARRVPPRSIPSTARFFFEVGHRRGARDQQDVGRHTQRPRQHDLGRSASSSCAAPPYHWIAQHRVVLREAGSQQGRTGRRRPAGRTRRGPAATSGPPGCRGFCTHAMSVRFESAMQKMLASDVDNPMPSINPSSRAAIITSSWRSNRSPTSSPSHNRQVHRRQPVDAQGAQVRLDVGPEFSGIVHQLKPFPGLAAFPPTLLTRARFSGRDAAPPGSAR